ncbi:MAG: L-histidine N(alpha)-methyltransferase [Planctomycetota bacterium]
MVRGLLEQPPTICSKYFYDQRGSKLFDQICELDEYYPTRTETEIMRRYADAMVARIGVPARLIEYGSGSSQKTRWLLKALPAETCYVPVDISAEHLQASSDRLRREFPRRTIQPVAADFTRPFKLPAPDSGSGASNGFDADVIYFPGSTIGNFGKPDALALLAQMAAVVQPGGGLLIGFDLVKDHDVLQAAYDDSAGVTAAFNRNILRHVNAITGADFDPEEFAHIAFFDADHGRIEMHLEAQGEQRVRVGGRRIVFQDGQRIRTEYSHKYTASGFCELATSAGWEFQDLWTDDRRYFAVARFQTPRGSGPSPEAGSATG